MSPSTGGHDGVAVVGAVVGRRLIVVLEHFVVGDLSLDHRLIVAFRRADSTMSCFFASLLSALLAHTTHLSLLWLCFALFHRPSCSPPTALQTKL